MSLKMPLMALILSVLTSAVLAKDVNLYDQPSNTAKVVGKVDLAIGVVPIFTSKAGDWMKVGNPSNGDVGWVKTSDMSSPGSPTSITFTQKIVNDKSGPHSVQLLQFGSPENLTPQQTQDFYKKMQVQQLKIQQYTQKAIQDMLNQMNSIYQWNGADGMNSFPMIMPIVIVPPAVHPTPGTPPATNKK